MRYPFALTPATFIERPNRYLVMARLHADGTVARAHCPDPGRLLELFVPGATLHLSEAATPERRTSHTVRLVEHAPAGVLVSVDSCMANRLFGEALADGRLEPFAGAVSVQREVRVPGPVEQGAHSRIDYRLVDAAGRDCWVEVKSATLVEGRTARFPDAVTARGARHVRELAALAASGHRAAVCWVVQRPDADCLRPQWDRDPAFATALLEASRAGVECRAWTATVTLTGSWVEREIPVVVERPVVDGPAGG